jgi:hypothetical protein
MKRVLILVEGQTEEQFIKTVLAPYLWQYQVAMMPTVITTKRMLSGSDHKGGLLRFTHLRQDMQRLFGDSNAVLFTTFIDYYGLPSDFPGIETATSPDPYKRVEHLEQMLGEFFGNRRFLPFLMLHEFEAFCFVDPCFTAQVMGSVEKAAGLSSACRHASGPEKINQGSKTHPARRLEAVFPGYSKVIDGVDIAARIGVEKLRMACPHFNEWLDRVIGQAMA